MFQRNIFISARVCVSFYSWYCYYYYYLFNEALNYYHFLQHLTHSKIITQYCKIQFFFSFATALAFFKI